MTTVLPDDYKTSIRVITYKGDGDNWCQWKIKMRAIGMKKKWVEALDSGYPFEATGRRTVPLDDAQKALKKKNEDACNYSMMACDGEPFDIITSETEPMPAEDGNYLRKSMNLLHRRSID
jgi:hypothetical protein